MHESKPSRNDDPISSTDWADFHDYQKWNGEQWQNHDLNI